MHIILKECCTKDKNSVKKQTECTYMNARAGNEGLVAVAMLHLDKELLLLSLIAVVTTNMDVNRFIDPTCEVLQGISCPTPSQCFIATSKSEEKRKLTVIKSPA